MKTVIFIKDKIIERVSNDEANKLVEVDKIARYSTRQKFKRTVRTQKKTEFKKAAQMNKLLQMRKGVA